ncbi:polysaccharide lyase family 7 protein [Croceivirga thetidis]|uniref:Polysaccharide lyase family 7 protein n=1 Tax=Croceivirga thetidis TaxID=2721623 RepID=A0ABX1GPA2_9FLAO|nr:polysaccharide lyase family 7 protein [Croceivirga thetidis]NKI31747.1 polysaccharide lyase family 7 protein [Croceivirga thetidis]
MNPFSAKSLLVLFLIFNVFIAVAQEEITIKDEVSKTTKKKRKKVKLPKVDLSNWSVTIPEGNEKGRATTVAPPEILGYANNDVLRPYMFNDSTIGALVFYAYPSNATTANTKYSRSELREQMEPGNNNVNWTFSQGGYLKAKMAMGKVSRAENGKYHKVIIAQIHGRLTNEQKELIGQKDNNAPPILKIYWDKGKIRVKTKELKYQGIADNAMLHKEAWKDDSGRNFEEEVGFKKFTIEIKVSDGKMVVSLNKNEFFVYENLSLKRWGVFENYFKVGNYLQTRDQGAFASVNLFELNVEHN